jgi:4-hydroxybenzoate polyprenyltransferase
MKQVIAFFRLIRLPNLLIIAFTQYMVRWCLLYPGLQALEQHVGHYCLELPSEGLHFQISDFDFFMLCLSTVMIAAAGYIINDYFDVKIDRINKPSQIVIDKSIKRRVAMGAHVVINILAFIIGVWLSWKYNFFYFGSFVFGISIILLWFYSTNFKRMFLAGNLTVAFLTGMVPLLVALFELPLQIRANSHCFYLANTNLNMLFVLVLIFSLFAFIVTLLREIIKDIEDVEGDRENGCTTLPVTFGPDRSKQIVAFLALIVMALLTLIQIRQYNAGDTYSFWYFTVFLQLPFALLAWRLFSAQDKKHYTYAGGFTKMIMLSGICYLFLYRHILMQIVHANQ